MQEPGVRKKISLIPGSFSLHGCLTPGSFSLSGLVNFRRIANTKAQFQESERKRDQEPIVQSPPKGRWQRLVPDPFFRRRPPRSKDTA